MSGRDGQHVKMPQLRLADAGAVDERAVLTLLILDPVGTVLET